MPASSQKYPFLADALQRRKEVNAYRKLTTKNGLVDFCSNDYLGFSKQSEFLIDVNGANSPDKESVIGSTGSRLITGNSERAEQLEARLAQFHYAPSGLLFNSGYAANLGVFSSVPQKGDTVLYDELIHASIRDGIRLSHANAWSFAHNDLQQLTEKLERAKGNVFVAVEAIYSMDGDAAPLQALSSLCKQYHAHLIVDEAHATGIFGEKGEGLCVELGVEDDVFARIHTFGKALGCHGAVVLGEETLRNYLINFSRPFIYTTALPAHSLYAIEIAYNVLEIKFDSVLKIRSLINLFKDNVDEGNSLNFIPSSSAIQCIKISGNDRVKMVAEHLQKSGYDVRPILSPTVAEGEERLRICLHAFNTPQQVKELLTVLKSQL